VSEKKDKANGVDQMRDEIWKVIDRYSKESDVTGYQTIGLLEAIKADLLDQLPKTP